MTLFLSPSFIYVDDNDIDGYAHDVYCGVAAEMRAIIHMTETFKTRSSQLEIVTAENEDLTSRWVRVTMMTMILPITMHRIKCPYH